MLSIAQFPRLLKDQTIYFKFFFIVPLPTEVDPPSYNS